MFPQVSAKCLRRQSNVSTASCAWCLDTGFREKKLQMWFSFQPRKRRKGAVLGDETAVAKAGCNTSSHCRGWLEGSVRTGSHSTSACLSACWRKTFTRTDRTVPVFILLFVYLFIIWLTWWGAWKKKAKCSVALKVDLADSLLNNMVALDWSALSVDPTVLEAAVRFSPVHTFAFEQVETSLCPPILFRVAE